MNKQAEITYKDILTGVAPDTGKKLKPKAPGATLLDDKEYKTPDYSSKPALAALSDAASELPSKSPAKTPPLLDRIKWKLQDTFLPKGPVDWGSREALSAVLDPVRNITKSPIGTAAGLGLLGAGLGYGLWRNIVDTGGSLGRFPITRMTGMTDDEYDEAMDEIASDNRYKWLLPGALATLLGGGYLALRWPLSYKKFASMDKQSDELFSYGGYVPDIDFHQVINAGAAKDMFTNDPKIAEQPYVKNMGLAIINDAANKAGYVNPTLGNIYDSTVQKMKSKLTWQGVTGVAANTMIANATAHLLTSAIGTVVPLPKNVKRNIIDGGTWAAAITSILT